MLMLPAMSDVAQVEEWDGLVSSLLPTQSATLAPALAQGLQQRSGQPAGSPPSLRVLAVDWPGFGQSGSPPIEYTADLMEDFLVDYVSHLFPGTPLAPHETLCFGASLALDDCFSSSCISTCSAGKGILT